MGTASGVPARAILRELPTTGNPYDQSGLVPPIVVWRSLCEIVEQEPTTPLADGVGSCLAFSLTGWQ